MNRLQLSSLLGRVLCVCAAFTLMYAATGCEGVAQGIANGITLGGGSSQQSEGGSEGGSGGKR